MEAALRNARAFYFVCADIVLLAQSSHLGTRNAGAQAPQYFDVLFVNVVRVGDALYRFEDGNTAWVPVSNLPPVPTSTLVAFGINYAITSSGEG